MSIWKGFINIFGFGGDNEEDEEEYDSSLPTYAAQPRIASAKPAVATQQSAHPVPPSDSDSPDRAAEAERPDNKTADKTNGTDDSRQLPDPQLPSDLFDALIEQFNAAQPDFISKCLSTDAQRSYLLNSLTDSLKQRLSDTLSQAGASGEADTAERERLQRRIAALEAEVKTTDTLRQENRKLNLSIERQKRALLDRINDLEAQVAKSHAEKEKFFSGKHNPADAALIDASNARVKELEQNLAERDAKITELDATITRLQNSLAECNEQLATQTQLREQLVTKTAMSDEMINDLRNRAAADRNEYEKTCAEQQEALNSILDQVKAFEQVKARLEARINELKEALKEEKSADRESQIARLNEENASLRHTIENNLYNQANSENRLRNEIKQLRKELEQATSAAASVSSSPAETYGDTAAQARPASETAAQRPAQRRRGRPKKVKLDDDLDNTEWFAGQKDDPDFGYHEPPRRPSNDNAAQLSLF